MNLFEQYAAQLPSRSSIAIPIIDASDDLKTVLLESTAEVDVSWDVEIPNARLDVEFNYIVTKFVEEMATDTDNFVIYCVRKADCGYALLAFEVRGLTTDILSKFLKSLPEPYVIARLFGATYKGGG